MTVQLLTEDTQFLERNIEDELVLLDGQLPHATDHALRDLLERSMRNLPIYEHGEEALNDGRVAGMIKHTVRCTHTYVLW